MQQSLPHCPTPRTSGPQQSFLAGVQTSPELQQLPPHTVDGGLQHVLPAQVPGAGQHTFEVPQSLSLAPQHALSERHLGVPEGQHWLLPMQTSPAPAAQQSVFVAVLTRHEGVAPGQQSPLVPQGSPCPLKQNSPRDGLMHLSPANIPSRQLPPQQSEALLQQLSPCCPEAPNGPEQHTVPALQCGTGQS
jgi:hypothetical protein